MGGRREGREGGRGGGKGGETVETKWEQIPEGGGRRGYGVVKKGKGEVGRRGGVGVGSVGGRGANGTELMVRGLEYTGELEGCEGGVL